MNQNTLIAKIFMCEKDEKGNKLLKKYMNFYWKKCYCFRNKVLKNIYEFLLKNGNCFISFGQMSQNEST